MFFVSVFNIVGSGMSVQSICLNIVVSNIVNVEMVFFSVDKIYCVCYLVFFIMFQQVQGDSGLLFVDQDSFGVGVQVLGIVEDQSLLMLCYELNYLVVDVNGYVYYFNVNVVEEMVDMIFVSCVFQINVEMMNIVKQMMQKVLILGQ